MKILVISFSYRPLNNPRAFRWTFLTEEISRLGHHVDIVTSYVPGEPEIESNGLLTVYRTGWKLIESLRARQRARRAALGTTYAYVDRGVHGSLRGVICRLVTRFWRALHWPDASCLWYPPARARALALTAQYKYDVVVSVAPSFTGVVVGRTIKASFPDLRWLIDLGDPFSFFEGAPPNNASIYAGLNRNYERAAFADAEVISVTNHQTRERYEEAFPESIGKISVIPPLLSLPKLPDGISPVRGKLVYVGTLYRHIREPGYLLELFVRATEAGLSTNTELHFLGDISSCIEMIRPYEVKMGGRIRLHGQVSREEVAVTMAEAEILINIGNDTIYQLPSKVVEYAASGKRILNLAKTHKDSSVLFFSKYPNALSLVSTSEIPSEDDVQHFVDFVATSNDDVSDFDLENWLAPYQPPQVVGEYLKLLGVKNA